MLAGMAVCSPRLSRNTYLHGVVDGALQLGTMLMPVVLTARMGVFRLSASGWTPTAELDRVGPRSARSSSCWISFWASWVDCALSEASSFLVSAICAPRTPPELLICLTASSAPFQLCGPYTLPAPVMDRMAPILIVLPAYKLVVPPPLLVEPHAATTSAATSPETRCNRFISESPRIRF